MSEPTHPPIPPNAEYFRYDNGDEEWVFCVLIGPGEIRSLSLPTGGIFSRLWRPIIAAVARCAWMDEGRRRCAALDAIDGGSMTGVRHDNESESNAEAWREWGMK